MIGLATHPDHGATHYNLTIPGAHLRLYLLWLYSPWFYSPYQVLICGMIGVVAICFFVSAAQVGGKAVRQE